MQSKRKIVLLNHYDLDYRQLLWEAVKDDYDRSGYGRQPYFDREIEPLIKSNVHILYNEDGSEHTFLWPELDEGYRRISEYLRRGGFEEEFSTGDEGEIKDKKKKHKPRKFGDQLIRMFDAYMKIKHPVIASTFSPHRDTDATGFVFGEFLSDASISQQLYEMEVTVQNLIGIYQYQEETTASVRTGNNRYLALFKGDTKGYLLVMDFRWLATDKIVPLNDEHLMLYYGFCIPGRRFSPVIMRSLNQRERQAGMMYGKEALIDFSAPTLDQIYLQTYTTDVDHFPDKPEGDNSKETQLFQEVLRLKEGPVLNRTMFRVNNDNEYNNIAKRIEKIKRNWL